MLETVEPSEVIPCPACGTEMAPSMLTCPRCKRLVNADRLKVLAAEAEEAHRAGDLSRGMAAWRDALELLPPGTRQHETVSAKIADLGRRVDAAPAARTRAATSADGSAWAGGAAGVGTLALLALSKGKLLLLGLTKLSTFSSMFLTLGVYWTIFGWQLALGLLVSIYIHEMGHVVALMRYGVRADPPMFIPGFGAMIRVRQHLGDPRQEARVGLAGPIWGLGAAIAAYGMYVATSAPIWAAIAQLGAVINLFNLIPFWQLDGGRAFHALTRNQRWLIVVALGVACSFVVDFKHGNPQNFLLFVVILAAYQAWVGKPAARPDWVTFALYLILSAALMALSFVPVNLGR